MIVVDSISAIAAEDAGAIVVSGSHGGASAGEIAQRIPLAAAFFNDAGVGKDRAGIVALDMLQARGVAAGTIAHTSARIGDAQDAWENGVLSHVNAAAKELGLLSGLPLKDALTRLVVRVTRG